MTDRKKPGVAFWITVALVVALIGYPLSFGPACWLTRKGIPPEPFMAIYRPIVVASRTSEQTYSALIWYIELWAGPIEEERPEPNI